MLTVFVVHVAPGADPDSLLTDELRRETHAQTMTLDEAKKVEEIYATAAKNETESKARAKENGTDNKTLQGYMATGKNETINKIKEVLDKDKQKAFNDLLLASVPDKKKKK